jgi:hypothetical protein
MFRYQSTKYLTVSMAYSPLKRGFSNMIYLRNLPIISTSNESPYCFYNKYPINPQKRKITQLSPKQSITIRYIKNLNIEVPWQTTCITSTISTDST